MKKLIFSLPLIASGLANWDNSQIYQNNNNKGISASTYTTKTITTETNGLGNIYPSNNGFVTNGNSGSFSSYTTTSSSNGNSQHASDLINSILNGANLDGVKSTTQINQVPNYSAGTSFSGSSVSSSTVSSGSNINTGFSNSNSKANGNSINITGNGFGDLFTQNTNGGQNIYTPPVTTNVKPTTLPGIIGGGSTTSQTSAINTIKQQSVDQILVQQKRQDAELNGNQFPPIDLTSAQFSDPAFLKIINNYFGCKTWSNGQCVECSNNYYFNKKGICCQVKPQCQMFNKAQGICEICYPGFQVLDGKCQAIDLVNNVQYKGCKKFGANKCTQCAARYIFDSKGVCTPVNPNCQTWNDQGLCLTCYGGFVISNGNCIVDTNIVTNNDPLCGAVQGSTCVACAYRAFFNQNKICQKVKDECNTWDKMTGQCLTCYKGYKLDQTTNNCLLVQQNGPSDPGCAQWNWDTLQCLKCSVRYAFDSNKICQPLDNNCAKFNQLNNQCVQCYKGFQLNAQNKCVQLKANLQGPTDKGCARWDWDKQICLQCAPKWKFDKNNKCVETDLNCQQFDNQQQCVKCFKGFVLDNNSKICVTDPVNSNPPVDLGCKKWNWDLQVCQQCSEKWIFNLQGKCIQLDPNCKSFNSASACTECFKGFKLSANQCIVDQALLNPPTDIGCASWNWQAQQCLKCSQGYMMSQNGQCLRLRDDCKVFDTKGLCVQCYKGFQLNNKNECIISLKNQEGPKDLNCAKWDWDNRICMQCSQRFVFNSQGICVQVNDNCKEWDLNGVCTSCYKGYSLNAQTKLCVLNSVEINGPTDLGCAQWNWDLQVCKKCSPRFIFDSLNKCQKVNDLCSTWNLQGACTSCYQGYVLMENSCVMKAPFCKDQDMKGNCNKCYDGFVLYKAQCTPLSRVADIALYYAECCPEKLLELKQNGRLL